MLEINGWLFVVASLVLIIAPGQDMILVMSRSIARVPGAWLGKRSVGSSPRFKNAFTKGLLS